MLLWEPEDLGSTSGVLHHPSQQQVIQPSTAVCNTIGYAMKQHDSILRHITLLAGALGGPDIISNDA